jgi:D-alanine--poly(phosphoribitol) ligase subunit 2
MNKTDLQILILKELKEFVAANNIVAEEITLNTRLIGLTGILDSLDLVSFIVHVEETINDNFSIEVSLTDERAMSRTTSPFLSIEALCRFILEVHVR